MKEELLKVFNLFPDSILITDFSGNLIYLNRKAESFLSSDNAEKDAIKNNFFTFFSELPISEIKAAIKENEFWENEIYTSLKSIFPVPFKSRITAVKLDGMEEENLLIIIKDNQEKLELDKKLQQLYDIVNTIPAPLFVKDVLHNWIFINDAFCKFAGKPREELIGKSDYDFFPREEADVFWYNDNRVLLSQEEITNEETFTPPNEYPKTLLTKKKLLVNNSGEKSIVGIITDITDRKKFENELIQLKEKAENANLNKTEFLANMTYEIRTPLNAILGFAEILEEDIKEPRYRKYLDSIIASSKNLLSLINDILDLHKLESGKLVLRTDSIHIHAVLNELKEVFSVQAEEKSIKFYLDIDPALPRIIFLDEARLKEILFNLLNNAVKFTEKGEIRFKIHVNFKPDRDSSMELAFTVEDTGIGISAEDNQKIFKAFYLQLEQNKNNYPGTGLGLTLSSRLAELMNGTLEVKSAKGIGSTFTLSLKNTPYSNSAITNVKKDSSFKKNWDNIKVLVADDIDYNRNLISDFLKNQNIELIEASDGKKAIQMAKDYLPDIILMDIRMPILDGLEACKILKKDKQLQSIPIIVLTAYGMQDDDLEIKNFSDDFLNKPFNKKDVLEKIQKFIAGKRNQA